MITVWLYGAAVVATLMAVTWAASYLRVDASLVDRVWGLGFVVAAWVYAVAAPSTSVRAIVVVSLVTIWGLRLSAFITWRNWGHGEDKRYRAMRDKRPDSFALRSLVTVFLLQAVLAAVISVPLLAAIAEPSPPEFGWLDVAAVALWLIGFVFEAFGDAQLARFRADEQNRDKVMDRGLWRYTRHPNYFGDTVVWWSYGLFAVAVGAWWALAGALLMTVLIVKVSGVALTDATMKRSNRPGYDAYVRRTNAFVPGPRKPAAHHD